MEKNVPCVDLKSIDTHKTRHFQFSALLKSDRKVNTVQTACEAITDSPPNPPQFSPYERKIVAAQSIGN